MFVIYTRFMIFQSNRLKQMSHLKKYKQQIAYVLKQCELKRYIFKLYPCVFCLRSDEYFFLP